MACSDRADKRGPLNDLEAVMAKAKKATKVQKSTSKVTVTLGDLIAAACETVGSNATKVAKLISSSDLQNAMDKRIVFV
jgi:hypothetical protein